jgi:hypothetical protein
MSSSQAVPAEVRGDDDRYRILGHVATGGMAEILLVRATGLAGFEKLVVIKRLLPHLARDEEFVQMFLDEARLAATLHHPNIGQVYDIGRLGPDYFFSMEFIEGINVSELMTAAHRAGRRIPMECALYVVNGVCSALHYAHEKRSARGWLKIVHRDVSMQNVLVTFDGAVKLVDFGIAKTVSKQGPGTRDGSIKGKLRYMSPEQCRGEAVDRRSDVFSMAIVLWELTTGHRLIPNGTDLEILTMITTQDARPPSSVVPDYPPELERIVLKGLRRNREERYQTMQEMQLDIEAFIREQKLSASGLTLARLVAELFPEGTAAMRMAREAAESAAAASPASQPIGAYAKPEIGTAVLRRRSATPEEVLDRPIRGRRTLVIGAVGMMAVGIIASDLVTSWQRRRPAPPHAVTSPPSQAPVHSAAPVESKPAPAVAPPAPVESKPAPAVAPPARSAVPSRAEKTMSHDRPVRKAKRRVISTVKPSIKIDPDAIFNP